MAWVGGDNFYGIGFCIVFLTFVRNSFGQIVGGVQCLLACSPSEVGMVTPSEGCVSGWSDGGVGSTGMMPGVFAIVTRWCVHGTKRICVGAVCVDEIWVVFVGVGVTFSALAPIFCQLV